MDSLIANMSVKLRKAKGQVAILLAGQKRLQDQLHSNMNMVTQYQVKALAAVGRGEDELARDLLKKKRRYEKTVEQLEDEYRNYKRTSDRLMETVRLLELKLEETKRKKLLLLTQRECYETSALIEDGHDGTETGESFREMLEDIEDEVNAKKWSTQVGLEVENEALDFEEEEDERLMLDEGTEEEAAGSLDDELDELRSKLSANPNLLEEAQSSQVMHLIGDEDEEEDEDEEDVEEDDSADGIQILSTDSEAPPPARARPKHRPAPPPEPEPEPEEDDDEDGIIFIT